MKEGHSCLETFKPSYALSKVKNENDAIQIGLHNFLQATHFSTKNPINKPAMNNRRILIAALFQFVHPVEKDSVRVNIGFPVVQARSLARSVGRCTVTWLSNFLRWGQGWIAYYACPWHHLFSCLAPCAKHSCEMKFLHLRPSSTILNSCECQRRRNSTNTLEMQLIEKNVTLSRDQGKCFDRPGEVFHCFDRQ